MGGIVSGIFGGGEKSDSQEAQLAAMRNSAKGLDQYRPEAMQARMNVMNQAAGAYQGANNALETMYGGRSKAPPGMISQDWSNHLAYKPNAPSGYSGYDPVRAAATSPMANPSAGNPQYQGKSTGQIIQTVLDPLGIFW